MVQLAVNRNELVPVIALSGSLDMEAVREVESGFMQAVEQAVNKGVVVDLSGASLVTTPAISLIISARRKLNGRLAVACDQPHLVELLRRLKLENLLAVCLTVGEAVERVRGDGMIYRPFGGLGWRCSAIGLGTWNLGGQWGAVSDAEAVDIVRTAVDRGVNFFDTADAYGDPPGRSEELLGRALASERERHIVVSKVGNFARRQGHALPYTHPLQVELCCDASLHRLKTDYLDVLLCHIGDLADPGVFREAFATLKRKGKIRACGISTNSLESLKRFCGDDPIEACELDYSIVNRAAEKALLPWCAERGIATIIRGPLAMGLLSGRYGTDAKFDDSVRAGWNEGAAREQMLRRLAVVEKLAFLKQEAGGMAQAALRWVLANPAVSVAIPGAKSVAQMMANASAGHAAMDAKLKQRVDDVTG